MAAQDYYSQGRPSAPQQQAPQPQQPQQYPQPPSQPQANLQPPYPMSDQPPPYSAYGDQQRPQSQPPPGQRIPQQNYNYQGYQPSPPNGRPNAETHQYPPDKNSQRPPNVYRNSDYSSSNPPPYQQRDGYGYGYGPTPVAPGLSQAYPNDQRPGSSGYTRPSRSRDRRDQYYQQPQGYYQQPQKKKGTGKDTFLGAGGGAIIGDLIFPGLGTVGGALLGGLGGHEYGKHKNNRSQSNPSRSVQRSYSHSGDYYQDDYRKGRG